MSQNFVSVGETSGKASKGLAKHIPGSGGLSGVQGQAGTLGGELSRARQVSGTIVPVIADWNFICY